jgi:c-di-GMP-binding flagellar brake protein YcgR
MKNKRNFFRVGIKGTLTGTMVDENKNINIIQILNVSAGGLSFINKLNFHLSKEKIYTFNFELLDEKFEMEGIIMRKSLREHDDFIEYGIKFISLNREEESRLIRTINKYQIKHYRYDNDKVGE